MSTPTLPANVPANVPATPAEVAAVETTRAAHLNRVRDAAEGLRRAEAELRQRVVEAQAVGANTSALARALDVSRQAVQQRFPRATS